MVWNRKIQVKSKDISNQPILNWGDEVSNNFNIESRFLKNYKCKHCFYNKTSCPNLPCPPWHNLCPCPCCPKLECPPGPPGPQGPRGPVGPRGPAGPTITANSMFASNIGGLRIPVSLTGTLIPLPDAQNLNSFRKNMANTVFTIPRTGRYFISYNIHLRRGFLMKSQLLNNGIAIPATTINPILPASRYNTNLITNLSAGDKISLQLSGLIGLVILLEDPGASLTVIRLE